MVFPLLQNLVILLGLALVFLLFAKGDNPFDPRKISIRLQFFAGIFISLLGILIMAARVPLSADIVFDSRSVLLATSGIFFGLVPTALAVIATILFRIWEGGAGVFTGSLVILSSAAIGLVFRRFRKDELANLRVSELYGVGLLVHVAMVLIIAIALPEAPSTYWTTVVPVVIVFFPPTFVALSWLLVLHLKEQRRRAEVEEAQTETNRLEEALYASRNESLKLARAVEQSPVSIVVTDTDGVIQQVNPFFTTATGYTREEAIGQPTRILNAGVQPVSFYRRLWTEITAGRVWRGEFCNRRKDGSLFWEAASIAPVKDDDDRILGFVAVKQDITGRRAQMDELESARRQAEAAAEAKQAFLSVMSHEFRTPLHQILGPCQLVLEETEDPLHKNLLHNAVNASEELLSLVEKILRYSKEVHPTEGGWAKFHDATLWLENTAHPFEDQAARNGFHLKIAIEQGFPPAFAANRVALEFIAVAYLENALKFGDHGAVTIRLARAGDNRGILQVENEGPPLEYSDPEELFQPFSQLDMTQTRRHGGIGLGLALCRRYAESFDATVGMKYSENGPIFYCEFPMKEEN